MSLSEGPQPWPWDGGTLARDNKKTGTAFTTTAAQGAPKTMLSPHPASTQAQSQ